MTNLIIKRQHGIVRDGNKLSGNTFPVKDYIKTYLAGKWDAATKSWIIDESKLDDLISRKAISVDDSATVAKKQTTSRDDGWCNKCHSWCYGDCTSND